MTRKFITPTDFLKRVAALAKQSKSRANQRGMLSAKRAKWRKRK